MTPPGPFKLRFGRFLWRWLHGIADRWPCDRCRADLSEWMSGLHDAVNVRLGKKAFRPEAYERFVAGGLEAGSHAACFGCRLARLAARGLARAPPARKQAFLAGIAPPSLGSMVRKE